MRRISLHRPVFYAFEQFFSTDEANVTNQTRSLTEEAAGVMSLGA